MIGNPTEYFFDFASRSRSYCLGCIGKEQKNRRCAPRLHGLV